MTSGAAKNAKVGVEMNQCCSKVPGMNLTGQVSRFLIVYPGTKYYSAPKYNQRLYINIKPNRLLYLGT